MNVEEILTEVIAISFDHAKTGEKDKEKQKWVIQTINACKLYLDNHKMDQLLNRIDSIEKTMDAIDAATYFPGE